MATAMLDQPITTQKPEENEGRLCVAKLQRTCVHDGPGLRTTVFFKGCGLRCLWCQNPENLRAGGEALWMTPGEIITELRKDAAYYQSTGGGVTLSGGEPLLQNPQLLGELLQALRDEKIPVSVETTLHVPWAHIEALAPLIGLFLLDFKCAGDAAGHKALTGQEDALIRSNVKKLLALKPRPKVRARMVIVPGKNDSPAQIAAAAKYLKSLKFKEIELLQYHTMHEEKAARLGLDIPQLGITPAQALPALKAGAEAFRAQGLAVYSDSLQEKPRPAVFTERVLKLRDEIRACPREVCFETSHLKTDYYKKYKGFRKPVYLHRAERLYYVLENRTIHIYPGELLVGNFTAKRVAGQVWEEQFGVMYATFLYKGEKMTPVQFVSSKEERLAYYKKIVPYWLPRCIIGRFTRENGLGQLTQSFSSVAEQKVGFQNNFAAIAHFIVNFSRILELGTMGLKREVRQARDEHPEQNRDLYTGMLVSLQALERFGERYAQELERMIKYEPDDKRRAELRRMAEVCKRVPKYPARTFHEALQSMLFLQIAICAEAYENAVSHGRFDQILQPYYEADRKAGRITYDEAKELLALWVLKMDEVFLISDGDGIFNISKLFETVSTDQAMTFGGVKPDGTDGVNDVTYMLMDICELQPLSVNMCARIAENSPQAYLDRLAELYVGACPMPELFSDAEYIPSLLSHYNITPEDARNYAITGCVEPNASSEHFGNTDSANMNVTLPLLQAMKGQSDDLWNYGFAMQLEKFVSRGIDYFTNNKEEPLAKIIRLNREEAIRRREERRGALVCNPPGSMEELLARYQERLNFLARSVLADQQKVEAVLARYFPTPLASTLFKSCVSRGKDAYEGGADFNTAGIQAVGITDTADSLYAIDQLVYRQKKYSMEEMCRAVDDNFESALGKRVLKDVEALPKFGDNRSDETARWVTKAMEMYNIALAQCPYALRNGHYSAGYYALNTSDRYGKYTGALPSGRKKGVPLANSVTPHYGAAQDDLLSALNDISKVNFRDYAPNGTTVTFTIDAALFPGQTGVRNLSEIFRTFLTQGGMQFQPNVVSRELLLEAYEHPEKHPYLMVRVAGYCSYFNELSDDLKKVIINRTCYA
ncbi:MAG: radical SAM protein [Oscillospiraceae bacterium]|jgi:formate C-acetyltransferase|nr:radical SAM protein [Oscillospiraceae bacterium]